jgi:hypothetical protein
MPFEAFYSRLFWLVVYLEKPAAPLAFSRTMLNRVQPSADDANIVADIHTPGMNIIIAAGKVIGVALGRTNESAMTVTKNSRSLLYIRPG